MLRVIMVTGDEEMTGAELKKALMREGWTIQHGKAHDQATHSAHPGLKVPIPRHKGDIPAGTLKQIKKETGLQ